MDQTWVPPEGDFFKINVHCIELEAPNGRGIKLSVGVIVRNRSGQNLWGGSGHMPGMSRNQAILWAFQVAAVECLKMDHKKVHFETDSMFIFDTIRFQDDIHILEELQEAMLLINSLYANNFEDQKSSRIVSWIPVEQNQSARYLAEYGLENANLFGEIPHSVGNLQFFLDRDMGRAVPFEVMDNLGMGDVIDADPPPELVVPHVPYKHVDNSIIMELFHALTSQAEAKSGKLKNTPFECPSSLLLPGTNNAGQGSSVATPSGSLALKGKSKLYEKNSFNNNGILSSAAVEILESGALNHISEVFAQQSVNLDSLVCQDVTAREVLDQATLGWSSGRSGASSSGVNGIAEDNSTLMDVAEVMAEWDSFVAPNAEDLEDEYSPQP